MKEKWWSYSLSREEIFCQLRSAGIWSLRGISEFLQYQGDFAATILLCDFAEWVTGVDTIAVNWSWLFGVGFIAYGFVKGRFVWLLAQGSIAFVFCLFFLFPVYFLVL